MLDLDLSPHPPDPITPDMIEALERTKPWVRFLSIVGFVGAGLMVIAAFVLGAAGDFMKWLALLYAFLAFVYLFGARALQQYANAIDAVITGRPTAAEVEDALWAQQAFWRFAGILVIIMLASYVVAIPVAIALATRPATPSQGGTTDEPSRLRLMFSTLEKQKKTMADLRAIAFALEARATDTNEYPPPMSIDELAQRRTRMRTSSSRTARFFAIPKK